MANLSRFGHIIPETNLETVPQGAPMIKISYSLWQKNKNRGDETYWCRVREKGHSPLDVNLHTKNKAQAEAFVLLRKHEVELYNAQLLAGESADASKILRRDTYLMPQKGTSKPVLTLRECLDEWECDLRRRNFSSRTIRTYTTNVSYVLKDLGLSVTTLTPETVRRMMTEHDKLKASTRRCYFVSFKEFLRYCIKNYGVSVETLEEIPKIHQTQTDRPYWTIQEVRKIIDNVHCKSKLVEDNYKAWLWFVYQTGCRQNEGGAVTWDDISNDGIVTFRAETTKGRVQRRVPLEWRILEMINRLPRKSKLVFHYIHPAQPSRFAVLAKAVKAAGVKPGGLHTLRHSCAYLMYKKTTDIKATAEMLGHSPATALKFYQASRSPDQLREIVTKTFEDQNLLPSPLDRLLEEDLI